MARSKVQTPDITRHFFERSKASEKAFEKAQLWKARLSERLEEEGEFTLASKLQACGGIVTLVCTGCGGSRRVPTACRQKWCPVCARALAARRCERYRAAVEKMKWPLFGTLTMPNCDDLTGHPIRILRRAFGRLRHTKMWKGRTMGGVAGIEITNIGNGWHPHLHFVIDCKWLAHKTPMPQAGECKTGVKEKCRAANDELCLAWARALRVKSTRLDWFGVIVKIKRCSAKGITSEVLKYSCKGSDLVESVEPVGELIRQMQATRLVTSFGTLFGLGKTDANQKRGACPCPDCQSRSWVPQALADKMMTARRPGHR